MPEIFFECFVVRKKLGRCKVQEHEQASLQVLLVGHVFLLSWEVILIATQCAKTPSKVQLALKIELMYLIACS